MLERAWLKALMGTLGVVRWAMTLRPSTARMLHLAFLQPLLAAIGRWRARRVFLAARARCPAYRKFLEAEGYSARGPWRLDRVPVSNKQNYVKAYSIEERCYGGRLPGGGVVIDESSGSSGMPNNWVRSRSERRDVGRILQGSYDLVYGDHDRILLNCFALGPWATGMSVSMALADVGNLKSIGPDAKKLEATLVTFGPSYRYLVMAYPPFARAFVDATALDLSAYHLDLVCGGEGISEALRTHLSRSFRSIVSSYGASDLEINLGLETALTIALRRRCAADPALCRALFGRDTPPMIFQYNALDFVIETSADGTLLFTVCRADGAAPKLRYDLKDIGGTLTARALGERLRAHGVDLASLAGRRSAFPLLYVFGRGDLTVAFYGAKLYPTDLEEVIQGHVALAAIVRGFQFACIEDEEARKHLEIHIELVREPAHPVPDPDAIRDAFYDGLADANQDFREVRRMFAREALVISVHACGTGPFEGADDRIKRKYIAEA